MKELPPQDAWWVENLYVSCDDSPPVAATTAERVQTAISCLDLTALDFTETEESIVALCERAVLRTPVAAVCVRSLWVPLARTLLEGTGVRVATVSGNFPSGWDAVEQKVAEVRTCVGANEIDVPIDREYVQLRNWKALFREVVALKVACHGARLKAILETGEIRDTNLIALAASVCMLGGADFIKTSTGKTPVGATYSAGRAIAFAIRSYYGRTGRVVGLKASGGIRTTEQAMAWLALVEAELGQEWLCPERFRLGASGLLDELRRA